jgi:hypothetical protein
MEKPKGRDCKMQPCSAMQPLAPALSSLMPREEASKQAGRHGCVRVVARGGKPTDCCCDSLPCSQRPRPHLVIIAHRHHLFSPCPRRHCASTARFFICSTRYAAVIEPWYRWSASATTPTLARPLFPSAQKEPRTPSSRLPYDSIDARAPFLHFTSVSIAFLLASPSACRGRCA